MRELHDLYSERCMHTFMREEIEGYSPGKRYIIKTCTKCGYLRMSIL